MHEPNTLDDLLEFLQDLYERKIHYSLKSSRADSILVDIDVPGERWEVEFMKDGSVEIERFLSTGTIEGRERIDDLFARFSD